MFLNALTAGTAATRRITTQTARMSFECLMMASASLSYAMRR